MSRLYYTPPSENHFREVKEKAIEIWKTYDNTYGYADEKINAIKDIKNVGDNLMAIVSMFDENNQKKLSKMLSDDTRVEIFIRLKDGGLPDEYNYFTKPFYT